MNEPDRVRMRHMLEAAREAIAFAQGSSRASIEGDRKLALAIIKDIEIIGEAAANVSVAEREHHPDIPWRAIVAMRNRLIHGYFDVDYDQVWGAVRRDLPPLIAALERALE